MKGPRPQPTALRTLRGNPGRRPVHTHPVHPLLTTDCPDVLRDPVARAEWDRIAPALIAQQQVTTVDRAMLIAYCEYFAQWQALSAKARRRLYTVHKRTRIPIPNPLVGMANKAFGLMLKAAVELGITPSSRSRVAVKPPAPTVSKWAGAIG